MGDPVRAQLEQARLRAGGVGALAAARELRRLAAAAASAARADDGLLGRRGERERRGRGGGERGAGRGARRERRLRRRREPPRRAGRVVLLRRRRPALGRGARAVRTGSGPERVPGRGPARAADGGRRGAVLPLGLERPGRRLRHRRHRDAHRRARIRRLGRRRPAERGARERLRLLRNPRRRARQRPLPHSATHLPRRLHQVLPRRARAARPPHADRPRRHLPRDRRVRPLHGTRHQDARPLQDPRPPRPRRRLRTPPPPRRLREPPLGLSRLRQGRHPRRRHLHDRPRLQAHPPFRPRRRRRSHLRRLRRSQALHHPRRPPPPRPEATPASQTHPPAPRRRPLRQRLAHPPSHGSRLFHRTTARSPSSSSRVTALLSLSSSLSELVLATAPPDALRLSSAVLPLLLSPSRPRGRGWWWALCEHST
mmetsp:Transcript_8374/g.26034  ORF Transcript_8374/g.26034 Transcript_8374/m.26034 type:complete len:427 (-) Transcript_8374:18-1298(-)